MPREWPSSSLSRDLCDQSSELNCNPISDLWPQVSLYLVWFEYAWEVMNIFLWSFFNLNQLYYLLNTMILWYVVKVNTPFQIKVVLDCDMTLNGYIFRWICIIVKTVYIYFLDRFFSVFNIKIQFIFWRHSSRGFHLLPTVSDLRIYGHEFSKRRAIFCADI